MKPGSRRILAVIIIIVALIAGYRIVRVVIDKIAASRTTETAKRVPVKAAVAGISIGILAPDGRVMEILSEHTCQGWLEGYLLTGRHGLFSCYEAFIHLVGSMFNQHAKWLKVCNEIPWRRPIASLNYLLTSHVWRQDHNGFSHQDPGFIDLVTNKSPSVCRVYLPPDANTLLAVADHCLRSTDCINVIVAGKAPAPQWLTIDEAAIHAEAAGRTWRWTWAASTTTAGKTLRIAAYLSTGWSAAPLLPLPFSPAVALMRRRTYALIRTATTTTSTSASADSIVGSARSG